MTADLKSLSDGQQETNSRSYSLIASIYDSMNSLLTGGQNTAARLSQLAEIEPGDRVLYAGAGTCDDALEAALKGAKVTCLDLSAGMLEKGRQRFEKAGLVGEFVCCNIMEYTPDEPFDIVTANFFLNIFSRPVMENVLAKVVSFVRPEGKLLIADFARPYGNPLLMVIHSMMFHGTFIAHWTFGLVSLHLIYDYTRYYPDLGMQFVGRKRFRLYGIGPWLFEMVSGVKVQGHDATV